MELLTVTALCLLLSLIVYQDFSSRSIAVWTLSGIVLLSCCYAIQQNSLSVLLAHFTFNLGFVATQLLAIAVYFSIKHRRWVNITKAHIGWGDVLFFIPIAILFTPFDFVLFYVFSLILALVGFLIYTLPVNQTKSVSIPLAGIMAACLVVVLLAAHFLGFDLQQHYVYYSTLS